MNGERYRQQIESEKRQHEKNLWEKERHNISVYLPTLRGIKDVLEIDWYLERLKEKYSDKFKFEEQVVQPDAYNLSLMYDLYFYWTHPEHTKIVGGREGTREYTTDGDNCTYTTTGGEPSEILVIPARQGWEKASQSISISVNELYCGCQHYQFWNGIKLAESRFNGREMPDVSRITFEDTTVRRGYLSAVGEFECAMRRNYRIS